MSGNQDSTVAARVWSILQNNIFAFVETGVGNAIVEAVAGSGKTTTIVEALKRVLGTSLFLAFNKAIADELKRRGVNARTFHSLCFMVVLNFKKQRDVTPDKLRQLVDKHLGDDDARMYGAFMLKLVGLARQSGIGCLVPDRLETWQDLVEHHDLELTNDRANMEDAIDWSRKLLYLSNSSPLVDFDDLLYIAVKDGLSLPKFDFVFVDEAQDTNAIQRALLRKVLKPKSRLVAVGDPAQAIYGFRGSDSDSMDLLATEFNCKKLPLTVSYRCPTSVVEYARQWVSHIEAAPGAAEGAVTHLGNAWNAKTFRPLDMIICRTTKPIIELAFTLIRAHVPAKIRGKEIGEGLVNLIYRMRTKDLEELTERLGVYSEREAEKARAKGKDDKANAIMDKAECIYCLIEGLGEDDRTVEALVAAINNLFADKANAVTLSTIHKAKGLEADRVFWLNSSLCPAGWVRQEWQQQQERNLCYVATTRAVKELILIEEAR